MPEILAPDSGRAPGNRARLRVIVTGGSRGIGRAVALDLARLGWKVAVVYHEHGVAADGVVREIEAQGGEAVSFQCDVRSVAQVRALAGKTARWGNPVHGLVTAAGIYGGEETTGGLERSAADIIGTDLQGSFRTVREFLPNFARDGTASVVTISSILASHASPGGAPYQMAKAGVEHMTRALALELAPAVRVNCVAPGFIRTDMNRAGHEEPGFHRHIARRTPLGRWGDPEDVSPAVRFLLGDDARWITGTVLHVDGGLGLR